MTGVGTHLAWILLLNIQFVLQVHGGGAYEGYGQNKPAPGSELDPEGSSMNDPGMEGTSKACRYDEGKGWSDCDPFELIRFKVLRLVHGGSQCEDIKNITKHCTPHEFPYGTHWLIQEHRKCKSELNRLKAMIGDLAKFIEKMNTKGKELFDVYMKLKDTFDDLTVRIEKMKNEGVGLDEELKKLEDELQNWKNRARDLQKELEGLKLTLHDLETEEHQLTLTNDQLTVEINIINKENEAIQKEIERIIAMNEELKRRITESEHTKEKLKDLKVEKHELHKKLEKLTDKLTDLKDRLAELKIQLLAKKLKPDEEIDTKDTHVDMNLEMMIVHNKTNLYKPEEYSIYYTTEGIEHEVKEEQPKCLISYYGTTNETCWYETDGEKSEDYFVDALGHHLVEAHWKYFTIDVKDQYECDKAAQLHYEFLLNRCSPKHFLPVLSAFRPSKDVKELSTKVFPAPKQPDAKKACWITFLGAHGHCEKHKEKYKLYNTPDLEDANAHSSKKACLSRQDWWQVYCDTPVLMTYVPSQYSNNWADEWIMHDSHGGRMFEDADEAKNEINPDSLNPEAVKPGQYTSDIKSEDSFSPDYHDSPEYRKSLHLEGAEKEAILASLRSKLGLSGPVDKLAAGVKVHTGIKTDENDMQGDGYEKNTSGYKEASAPTTYKPSEYKETTAAPAYETPAPYQPPAYETQAPHQPPAYETTAAPAYETPAPYQPPAYETPAPYEQPAYETPEPYQQAAEYETPAPYKPEEYETPAPATYETTSAPAYEEPKYGYEETTPAPEEYQPTEEPYKPAEYEPPKEQEYPPVDEYTTDTPNEPNDIYAAVPSTEYPGHPDAEPTGYKEKAGGYEQGVDPYSY